MSTNVLNTDRCHRKTDVFIQLYLANTTLSRLNYWRITKPDCVQTLLMKTLFAARLTTLGTTRTFVSGNRHFSVLRLERWGCSKDLENSLRAHLARRLGTRGTAVSPLELQVRQELLLRHRWQFHVDGFGVVVQGGRLAQDGERSHDRRDCEDPQEQPVQHHGHEAPVLIFLQKQTNNRLEYGSNKY